MYRDNLPQALREPVQAIQVAPRRQSGPVEAEEPQECWAEAGLVQVGGQQPCSPRTEPAVFPDEPLPCLVPGVLFLHRQRNLLAPVVIPADLRQPLELESGDLLRGIAANPFVERVPAPQKLLPHPGKGDDGGTGVDPLTVERDPLALAAEIVVRLYERDLMPRAAEKGGRGKPSDAATHDYYTLSRRVHG